ncbi:MAG: DEAD/DEAH box helicase, partial [Actinomycetes bacterium]
MSPSASSGAPSAANPIADVLHRWAHAPQLVQVSTTPARGASFGDLDQPLPADLVPHVPHDALWEHQARGIDVVRSGGSVVLATGTASGKSLVYQLPSAETTRDGGTALWLFPTKALAQGQLAAIT